MRAFFNTYWDLLAGVVAGSLFTTPAVSPHSHSTEAQNWILLCAAAVIKHSGFGTISTQYSQRWSSDSSLLSVQNFQMEKK